MIEADSGPPQSCSCPFRILASSENSISGALRLKQARIMVGVEDRPRKSFVGVCPEWLPIARASEG
jgi:hypothetical protein